MKRISPIFVLAAGVLLIAAVSFAQGYPTKPVRMILPFAPGGASDVVGRAGGDSSC